jgi:acetyl esterase/lipase
MPANVIYAAGHDLAHLYLSPLFGDFTKGFPLTLLRSDTRDLFLSNTVRVHQALRAARVAAELHFFEAATHVMFINGPDSKDRTRELRRFVNACWRRDAGYTRANRWRATACRSALRSCNVAANRLLTYRFVI